MAFPPVPPIIKEPTSIGVIWIDAQCDAADNYLMFCTSQVLDQNGDELAKPRVRLDTVINPGLIQAIEQALDAARATAEADLLP